MGYSSADVRKFLIEAFSDEEIETLCFDYFPEAHSDFSAGMSKSDKIQRLIEYCQRHDLVPQLFSALQLTRPDQYKKRFGDMPPPDQLQLVLSKSDMISAPGESLFAKKALLERLIANQYQSMRYYLLFAAGLIVLGMAVTVAAFIPREWIVPGALRQVIGVGGLFVCSLSALQFKEIVNRREKVGVCETIKGYLNVLEQAEVPVDVDTRRRIDNLFWQVIEKTAVG